MKKRTGKMSDDELNLTSTMLDHLLDCVDDSGRERMDEWEAMVETIVMEDLECCLNHNDIGRVLVNRTSAAGLIGYIDDPHYVVCSWTTAWHQFMATQSTYTAEEEVAE